MADERACVCSDACSGLRGGPGCTNEVAPVITVTGPVSGGIVLHNDTPHGGYRPPYLAARQPVSSSRRITERDVAFLFPGHRPALRVVRAERGDEGRDYGDEHRDATVRPRCEP